MTFSRWERHRGLGEQLRDRRRAELDDAVAVGDPASASALAPAVKRTMSMLCYGRAPAVRQPAWYPVRASTE
jgi:hypothetical protein